MRAEYGRSYAELYRRHWWWRARERILTRELRRLALPSHADILDFGCGNGLFFPKLRELGRVRGIETDASLLDAAMPDRAAIYTESLGASEYRDWKFDLITALDVMEHIQDDRGALAQLFSMLRPGGYLLLTVPAFMSLWDAHDERNEHFRRYSRRQLGELLQPFGAVLSLRYLFPSLFLEKYVLGAINSKRRQKFRQDAIPPEPINTWLSRYCYLESCISEGLPVPFGTSIMALVRV